MKFSKIYLAILLCFFSLNVYPQNQYIQTLDSLNYYLKFATLKLNSKDSNLVLVSKFHPSYIQTDVDDIEITDEMNKANSFFKYYAQNKKSIIIIKAHLWLAIIDLQKIDTNTVSISNNSVVFYDTTRNFRANVKHRVWKGFLYPRTIEITVGNIPNNDIILQKLYYFSRRAIQLLK